MAIATYFFLGWLVVYCFFLCKKRRTIVENTILCLFILIIHINWSWMMYEELAFLKFSHEPNKYLALLINRIIITPTIILLCFNLVKRDASFLIRALYLLITAAVLTFSIQLSTWLDVITMVNWNIGFDYLYFLSLIVICQLLLMLYPKFVVEKELRTK